MTLQYEMDRYVDDRKDEWKAEGIEEGMQKGKALGIEEGIVEGAKKEQANLVLNMFENGITMEQISKIANISIERVKKILSAQE